MFINFYKLIHIYQLLQYNYIVQFIYICFGEAMKLSLMKLPHLH